MLFDSIKLNAIDLKREFEWLASLIDCRLRLHSVENSDDSEFDVLIASAPKLDPGDSIYAQFIMSSGLKPLERAAFLLALAPNVVPELLDMLMVMDSRRNQISTEMGGRKLKSSRAFIPTGETAIFLLAGTNIERRMLVRTFFVSEHKFSAQKILSLNTDESHAPELTGLLVPSNDVLDLLTLGYIRKPEFTPEFPAKEIHTKMSWGDLVLSPSTKRQIEEVKIWLRNRGRLSNELGMSALMRPGHKILFYGAPGTGKTLTAALLGQHLEQPVYRVDLSSIVSKYIGETEKNLAKVFDRAENSDWILFFDEADALFGQRTKISSSHDRYANQGVSYLLQRIEDFSGTVILASNLKSNIDDAFLRRFNSVIHFPFPKSDERKLLWRNSFSNKIIFDKDVDLNRIAEKYELAGGSIVNAALWCQLNALDMDNYRVTNSMIIGAIATEYAKEGRTV